MQSLQRLGRRLRIEYLEDRRVLSTLTPTILTEGFGSLREAVLTANQNIGQDTIRLKAGTYELTLANATGQENASATGDLDITESLVVQGRGTSGRKATIIDQQVLDRVFHIVSPAARVVFKDLIITGGEAVDDGGDGAAPHSTGSRGGGILSNGASVRLINVVVRDNSAIGGDGADGGPSSPGGPGWRSHGGGVAALGGTVTLSRTRVLHNSAIGGSGGRGGDGAPAGVGGSGAYAWGAGLMADFGAAAFITNSTFSNNLVRGGRGGDGGTGTGADNGGDGGRGVDGYGGALHVTSGVLSVAGTVFFSNTAEGGEGGAGGDSLAADGGVGGQAGAGAGALDLYRSVVKLSHTALFANEIRGASGGRGGNGGPGGNGGIGGAGGVAVGGGINTGQSSLTVASVSFTGNAVQAGNGGDGGAGLIGGNGGGGGSSGAGGLDAWGTLGTLTSTSFSNNVTQGGTGGTGGSGTTTGGNGGQGGWGHGGAIRVTNLFSADSAALLLENSLVIHNRTLKGFGGAAGVGPTAGAAGSDGLAERGAVYCAPDAMLTTKRTRFIDNTPAG